MAWQIEFSDKADKALRKLDNETQKRIVRFLRQRVADMDNPRATGKPLIGAALGDLWRYRVGDHRLLCRIEDDKILVVVVGIGHRREIYKVTI